MTTATIGRYTLLEHLGIGNVTETFRASAAGVEGFEKSIALKRVLPSLQGDPTLIDSFVSTLRPAVALCHANIAQVLDMSTPDLAAGNQYWVAQYVAGWPLNILLHECRQHGLELPLELVMHLGLELSKALDYAHRLQPDSPILHGNVSPNNVLLSNEGEIKLTDFGVTLSLIQRNAILGLPADSGLVSSTAILSPEQLLDAATTTQSDVFGLAATLRECLAAPRAVTGDASGLSEAPPPLAELRPELPPAILAALERALALDVSERTRTAGDLHEELLDAVVSQRLRWSRANTVEWLGTTLTATSEVRPSAEPAPPAIHSAATEDAALEASLLLLTSPSDLGEAVRTRATVLLQRSAHNLHWLSQRQLCAAFLQPDGRDMEQAVRSGLALARTLGAAAKDSSIAIDLTAFARDPFDGDRISPQALEKAALQLEEADWHNPGRVVVGPYATRELRSLFRLKRVRPRRFAVVGTRDIEQASGPFCGREQTLQWLEQRAFLTGNEPGGNLTLVAGGVGLGKTRLLLELIKRKRERKEQSKICIASCPPQGELSAYSGVLSLLARLCEIREGDTLPRSQPQVLAHVAIGDIERVQGLLYELIEPNDQLDGELCDLAIRIVRARVRQYPHLLVLDGAHQLDTQSQRIVAAVREATASEVGLVLLSRHAELASQFAVPEACQHALPPMDAASLAQIIATRLHVGAIPSTVAEHFSALAQGNPFVLEELLREAVAQGQILLGREQIRAFDPDFTLNWPRSLRILNQRGAWAPP